ncbi:MAG: peptidoglycan-binding protein [Myxococcaceae bacterium]|nr:peptidoglycan-binding protein [Myxococcaceae bacterium]
MSPRVAPKVVNTTPLPPGPVREGSGTVAAHSRVELGSSGPEVTQLQSKLIERGLLPGPASGTFDAATDRAVRQYQKQNGLVVDGIVGQQTWGSLEGVSLPPGYWMLKNPLPSPEVSSFIPAGDPALDASMGVNAPKADQSTVDQVLEEARSHLGFHEGENNENPFSHAMGRGAGPWCADFVSFCARKAGLTVNTASAQGIADQLAAKGTWKGKENPQPGDAVTFRWDGSGGKADHVGLVERVYSKGGQLWIDTIEGNASDGVNRRSYPADSAKINGYGTLA